MGLLDGVLPAVYSAGNKLKRQVGGLLSDPVGTVQQQIGLLNDKAGAFNQLHSQATQEAVNAARTGAGIGPAQQKIAGTLADAYNPMGMVVWHGSPHKFSKFDSSKIGTGEGAQAYGHGLYLAESPTVAAQYKEALSAPALSVRGREVKTTAGTDMDTAKAWLDDVYQRGFFNSKTANPFDQAIKDVQSAPVPGKDGVIKALQRLKEADAQIGPGGALYKVDLPDDAIAKMLDWDKPLSRQSDELKALLEPMIPEIRKSSRMDFLGDVLGKGLYESVGNGVKSPETARKMQALGIPGIRYLDGGSRGAGGGTSNFVVFPGNEGLLSILERNGQPIK